MSSHEGPRPIDRATAELLLRGGAAARETGHRRIAGVLAAAAAPHRDGAVAGESAALAAFRAARVDPNPRPQRQSMIKTVLAKLLTVKIAAVTAGVLGAGGVAVASSAGALPGPLNFREPIASSSPHPKKTPPTAHPSGTASPKAAPPGLVWLCHDYIGRDRDHRRAALDDGRFKELADKAGGKDRDKADRFCDDLLHRWPNATATPRPDGKHGAPDGTPSPRSSERPDSDKPGDGQGDNPGDDQDSKSPTRPDGSLPPKENR
jgi:hypothetical protein